LPICRFADFFLPIADLLTHKSAKKEVKKLTFKVKKGENWEDFFTKISRNGRNLT